MIKFKFNVWDKEKKEWFGHPQQTWFAIENREKSSLCDADILGVLLDSSGNLYLSDTCGRYEELDPERFEAVFACKFQCDYNSSQDMEESPKMPPNKEYKTNIIVEKIEKGKPSL